MLNATVELFRLSDERRRHTHGLSAGDSLPSSPASSARPRTTASTAPPASELPAVLMHTAPELDT
ncbi:hypothetical protein PAHAL_7G164300 [Panicum hallii]|uniref:Uncharacterized protein n=1 Tax=Panicum hallii TaxID=206008 RepID=A0A2S3I718_9POAL|nr:hypothetical protein PAHAL_7G164300 [Panicum hallii]